MLRSKATKTDANYMVTIYDFSHFCGTMHGVISNIEQYNM